MFTTFRHRLTALTLGLALAFVTTLAPIDAGRFSPLPAAQAQAFGDTVENDIVRLLFRGTAWTPPTSLWVGLSTTACSDSSFGTEVATGSYARVEVTRTTGSWADTNGTNGLTSNSGAINFVTPTAGWGTVSHWFIASASAAGYVVICDDLADPKTINSGDTVSFAIGAMTITVQ